MTGRPRMRSLLLSFAMLSATGCLAPIWGKNADDAVDQTAMAIPRIGMPGAQGVALPQPLSPADAARIRRIFALQRAGSAAEATREMDRLENDTINGAILADRYLNTAYIPEAAELSAWLARFGDQPGAPAIRALLETLTSPAGETSASAFQRPRPKPGPDQNRRAATPARRLLVENDDRAAVEAASVALASGRRDGRRPTLCSPVGSRHGACGSSPPPNRCSRPRGTRPTPLLSAPRQLSGPLGSRNMRGTAADGCSGCTARPRETGHVLRSDRASRAEPHFPAWHRPPPASRWSPTPMSTR